MTDTEEVVDILDKVKRAIYAQLVGAGSYDEWIKAEKDGFKLLDNIARAAIDAYDGEQEYEYGYMMLRQDKSPMHIVSTTRVPESWLSTMGQPYRRLKAVGAGDWERVDVPTTIALDPLPWHKPGASEDYPSVNRKAEQVGGWDFEPRRQYEQDIEKYGFAYSACGRTGTHFPHSKLDGSDYCNGVVK